MYVCNVSFGEDFENLELQKSDFPNSLSIVRLRLHRSSLHPDRLHQQPEAEGERSSDLNKI
jgi:hypothetical protein